MASTIQTTISGNVIETTIVSASVSVESEDTSGKLGVSLVITEGQEIPDDVQIVYFTPPASVLGPPSDFDDNQVDCELNGFAWDNDTGVCSANGAVTTYISNFAEVELVITNEAADSYKWIINESDENIAYVSALYGAGVFRSFTIEPETSILIQKVNSDWRLLERIDNASGGVTYQGVTYTPSGSTQSVDLTYDEIKLNLTSGSGTLSATLVAPAGIVKGNITITQHAATQRDLTILSSLAIEWYGTEPDWVAAPVNTKWTIPFNSDGTTIKLQGTSATDLTVTQTTETVTVVSSTGADAVIPTVTPSLAGVLSAGKYGDFLSVEGLVEDYAMLVNQNNGWCSGTLMQIQGGEEDWTDSILDNWPVGFWRMVVAEGSGNVATTKLEVNAIDGAYFEHDGVTLGVRHNTGGGYAEYIVGNPSLFRTAIGTDSVYLALAGGTLTGKLLFSGTGHAGLQLNALTTAQYSALTAVNGDVFLDTTLNRVMARVNGTTRQIIDTAGSQSIAGTTTFANVTSTGTIVAPALQRDAGFNYFYMDVNGLRLLNSTTAIRIYATASCTGSLDLGLGRNAAGILEVNSGTGGTFRDLKIRDLYVNGMGSLGGGVGQIAIANATTVPTSDPTGGGLLYVEGGALKFRGSSGTVTTIAPA